MWDTAITVRALAASGVRPDNPAMREAVDWLLDRQITGRGDWTETVDAEPGGWCFEYANDFYPDCDDTAMVLMALQTQFADVAGATRCRRNCSSCRTISSRRQPRRRRRRHRTTCLRATRPTTASRSSRTTGRPSTAA